MYKHKNSPIIKRAVLLLDLLALTFDRFFLKMSSVVRAISNL